MNLNGMRVHLGRRYGADLAEEAVDVALLKALERGVSTGSFIFAHARIYCLKQLDARRREQSAWEELWALDHADELRPEIIEPVSPETRQRRRELGRLYEATRKKGTPKYAVVRQRARDWHAANKERVNAERRAKYQEGRRLCMAGR